MKITLTSQKCGYHGRNVWFVFGFKTINSYLIIIIIIIIMKIVIMRRRKMGLILLRNRNFSADDTI